jgi:hypothetical protein
VDTSERRRIDSIRSYSQLPSSLKLFAVVHPSDDPEETRSHLEDLLNVMRVDVLEIHVIAINIYHLRMDSGEDFSLLTEHNDDILVRFLDNLTQY